VRLLVSELYVYQNTRCNYKKLYTRTFEFCLLTKDEKTNFATGERHFCLWAHAACSGYDSAKNNICGYRFQRNRL